MATCSGHTVIIKDNEAVKYVLDFLNGNIEINGYKVEQFEDGKFDITTKDGSWNLVTEIEQTNEYTKFQMEGRQDNILKHLIVNAGYYCIYWDDSEHCICGVTNDWNQEFFNPKAIIYDNDVSGEGLKLTDVHEIIQYCQKHNYSYVLTRYEDLYTNNLSSSYDKNFHKSYQM